VKKGNKIYVDLDMATARVVFYDRWSRAPEEEERIVAFGAGLGAEREIAALCSLVTEGFDKKLVTLNGIDADGILDYSVPLIVRGALAFWQELREAEQQLREAVGARSSARIYLVRKSWLSAQDVQNGATP